ncbi:putative adenylate kinase 7, mitochondrial [Capsicum chinense]|nr:putative adenylate kinase 7, mitochondrial [Capsicum chinense]
MSKTFQNRLQEIQGEDFKVQFSKFFNTEKFLKIKSRMIVSDGLSINSSIGMEEAIRRVNLFIVKAQQADCDDYDEGYKNNMSCSEGLVPGRGVQWVIMGDPMAQRHVGESGFVLDGIPRSKIQDEILDKTVDIDLVLNLKCAEDLVSKKEKSPRLYPSLEFLCTGTYEINTSLYSEGDHFRPSSIMEDVSRKNLQVYEE